MTLTLRTLRTARGKRLKHAFLVPSVLTLLGAGANFASLPKNLLNATLSYKTYALL